MMKWATMVSIENRIELQSYLSTLSMYTVRVLGNRRVLSKEVGIFLDADKGPPHGYLTVLRSYPSI